jgi:hypothetical protein
MRVAYLAHNWLGREAPGQVRRTLANHGEVAGRRQANPRAVADNSPAVGRNSARRQAVGHNSPAVGRNSARRQAAAHNSPAVGRNSARQAADHNSPAVGRNSARQAVAHNNSLAVAGPDRSPLAYAAVQSSTEHPDLAVRIPDHVVRSPDYLVLALAVPRFPTDLAALPLAWLDPLLMLPDQQPAKRRNAGEIRKAHVGRYLTRRARALGAANH